MGYQRHSSALADPRFPTSISFSDGDDYKGYWLFPCNQVPSISLAFGGRYFTIPASALNLGRAASGSSDCVGAVVGQDPDASGLGTTFLGEHVSAPFPF